MNLTEAKAAILDGLKVKLPEFRGYWFGVQQEQEIRIKVLTANGDILDTPWFDKYRDRTDWEVTDGKLGFDFVILALENGKQLSRDGWSNSAWLDLFVPDANSKMTRPYIFQCIPVYNTKQFGSTEPFAGNTHCIPYVPTQTDMFAKDWRLLLPGGNKL